MQPYQENWLQLSIIAIHVIGDPGRWHRQNIKPNQNTQIVGYLGYN